MEEEFELPPLIEREGIDLFHSPIFRLPAILACRSVVTIHDAIPAVRPDLTNPDFARIFEDAPEAARRADAVVCPSEHAKRDVVRALGVPAEKVHVIPEAPSSAFRLLDEKTRKEARVRLGLEGRFLLVVGSLEKRKNPGVVLDALARVPDISLVFAGPAGGYDLEREAKSRCVLERIRCLGAVPDSDLVALYNEAVALVFPSLAEGFGLPTVEAFMCGTPVIASNASSIPEVAGDAAIVFDPEDADALTDAIRRILDAPEFGDDLRRRGRERLAIFSPQTVKSRLAKLYASLETRPA
ncbi:glycosyltransferase family 4 protein [bacterium]|nr:glycosyltransferase family 4 protein [bacterium]